MMTVCWEPGCPVVFGGPWYYCENHRTDEREAEAAKDHAQGVIQSWGETASEIIDAVNDDNEVMKRAASLAVEQTDRIQALEGAAHDGNYWQAIMHALTVGLYAGLIQASPYEYHANRRLRYLEPDAIRGRKVRDGGKKGADLRRKRPQDDTKLEEAVKQVHAEHSDWSWTKATEYVAGGFSHYREPITGKTVRRRMKHLQW